MNNINEEGRFLDKVDKTESCWNWTAAVNRFGHGRFKLDGKTRLAHRISYRMYVGEILDGLCILHKCHNPKCVNPNHLYMGTVQDNINDREESGRSADQRGEFNPRSKLKDNDILDIVNLFNLGIKQRLIAKAFKITPPTVHRIVKGKSWAHI